MLCRSFSENVLASVTVPLKEQIIFLISFLVTMFWGGHDECVCVCVCVSVKLYECKLSFNPVLIYLSMQLL